MDTTEKKANEHCVGPESAQAGVADSCAGCPNQKICASAPKGPDPDESAIAEKLEDIKYKILVLSGKGGVGKSTFSSQLSFALSSRDKQVGLLDVDICGPSIPKIVGVEGEEIHQSNQGWSPVYANENLSVMSIAFLLPSPDEAVIWRGPRKNGMIKQFIRDVDWGVLDYLVVDTPPGTSDEHLTILQHLNKNNQTGDSDTNNCAAVIVTTPQEVALSDVRKEINFCKKVGVRVIGVVENMSGFVCPKCHNRSEVFIPSSGGAEKMCTEMGVPFLGKIPLDPRLARACDEGQNFFVENPDSIAAKAFSVIVDKITEIEKKD